MGYPGPIPVKRTPLVSLISRLCGLPRRARPALRIITVLIVGVGALPARADNPIDAANERLAAEVSRRGREPAGALALFELWGHYDDSTPAKLRGALERLGADGRLSPVLRVAVRSMLAEAKARGG